MPEATEPDPTDRGTQRPNVAPLQEKGTEFILFECPDFEFEITLPANASPEDPITLFTLSLGLSETTTTLTHFEIKRELGLKG
jgi:hypothetical protein